MIGWNGLISKRVATIYFSDVKIKEILNLLQVEMLLREGNEN